MLERLNALSSRHGLHRGVRFSRTPHARRGTDRVGRAGGWTWRDELSSVACAFDRSFLPGPALGSAGRGQEGLNGCPDAAE
jgi:hypothetical protein